MKRYIFLALALVLLAVPTMAAFNGYIDWTEGRYGEIPNGTYYIQSVVNVTGSPLTLDQWCVANVGRRSVTNPPLTAGYGAWLSTKNTTTIMMPPFGNTPFQYNSYPFGGVNWPWDYAQIQEYIDCGDNYLNPAGPWNRYIVQHYYRFYLGIPNGSVPQPPVGAITCNAITTEQNNPFDLVCSPAETIFPPALNWSWVLAYPDGTHPASANETLVQTLNQDGWYGLDYSVCNSYGCGLFNTTQLVNLTTQESGIRLVVHTYDATRGAKVAPSQIKMQNTTSGLWLNWSTTGGTAIFDSMDPPDDTELLSVGQVVKICGVATGYQETCGNLTIPYNNYEYTINLIGTNALPTAGNATMIVNVIDARTAARIPGVTITVSNISAPYSSSKLGDDNGVATFSNIPAVAAYQISASKTGYQSSTRYWPVASGQVSNAYIGILPIGATPVPTTGPNGDPIYDTPTITGTTLAPGQTPDTRTDEEKDADMMGILRDNGETLIQFFILCFVLYMIMGIGGRK